MEWIIGIISSASTASLIGFGLWLSREILVTRLTNSVKHEYDTRLAHITSELSQNESHIQALRSGVLSNISTRKSLVLQRRIEAIEKLWNAVILFGRAKVAASIMANFDFDKSMKLAADKSNIRDIFDKIATYDLASLPTNSALETRPFVSPLAWAYFSAYQAIIMEAVGKIEILKIGLNAPEAIDSSIAKNLISAALPERVDYIEEYGSRGYNNLLGELENKLLAEFQSMMTGGDSDKEDLIKAAEIIKEADSLMAKIKTASN